MSALDEVDSLVLDVNRDVQAMVFFVRSPPRINTNEKFVSLAQTATSDFRALQAKTAAANAAYPDADTSFLSLELTIDAIQSFLVTTIKQMRDYLAGWLESVEFLSPAPSLEFLSTVASEMSNLVGNVISSTKFIRKVIEGGLHIPPPALTTSTPHNAPDIEPQHAQEVDRLLASPSSSNIENYFASSTPPAQPPSRKNSSRADAEPDSLEPPSFESLLLEYERNERREARLARKRADTAMKMNLKRAGIHVDPETLDSIVLHLHGISSLLLNAKNNFGQRPPDDTDDYTYMTPLDVTQRDSIHEHALALHKASTAMETFLTEHFQVPLATTTSAHNSDVMVSMKAVLDEMPQVLWSSLHRLDSSIKDYALTIKEVIGLSVPVYEPVEEPSEEDGASTSDDEPPPIEKPKRLLTKEEEVLLAFDGFADALDALDTTLTSTSTTQISPTSSPSITSIRSTNDMSNSSGTISFGMETSSNELSRGTATDQSAPSTHEFNSGSYNEPTSPLSSFLNQTQPSTQSAPNSTALPIIREPKSNGERIAPRSPRNDSRVTTQFSVTRPTALSNATKLSTPQGQETAPESPRRTMVSQQSISNLEATYEIADEAIRQADVAKVIDRWSEMQARSEQQKTVSPASLEDATQESWESSKVKAALKFMSKKVTDIRKAVGGNQVAGSPAHVRTASSSHPTASSNSLSASSDRVTGPSTSSPNATHKRRTLMFPQSSSSPILGSARRSMQLAPPPITDARCFLFEEPDNEETIRVSPETESVVAGTLEKLVQRLTHDSMSDPNFILHFLITYQCFTTPSDLLNLLILRWDTAPPPDSDAASFESNRLPSIRLRVYNVIKTWIEKFWGDLNEPELIERLKLFTARMYHGGMSSASQTLGKLIQKNMEQLAPTMQLPDPPQVHDFVRRSRRETPVAVPAMLPIDAPSVAPAPTAGTSAESPTILSSSTTSTSSPEADNAGSPTSSPSPGAATLASSTLPDQLQQEGQQQQQQQPQFVPAILTVSTSTLSRPLTILDFHPEELARQISRMEFELWKQVKNVELLEVAWTKKDKETRAPNVLNMIRFSNHITAWMISEILTPDDPKERSVVLNRCLWMVKHLLALRNFNGAMEALSAFHSSPIYRLKTTWNYLPPTSWHIFEHLERIMSPDANFKSYRNEYDRSVPPYMPYLGTHLSDLLFLEETIPRFVDGRPHLINFAKMEKTAQFIQTLELSQQIPYSVTPVPIIISYIKDYAVMDQKQAYTRSLACEARGKKARPNSAYVHQAGQGAPASPTHHSRAMVITGAPESPTTPRSTVSPTGSEEA